MEPIETPKKRTSAYCARSFFNDELFLLTPGATINAAKTTQQEYWNSKKAVKT